MASAINYYVIWFDVATFISAVIRITYGGERSGTGAPLTEIWSKYATLLSANVGKAEASAIRVARSVFGD